MAEINLFNKTEDEWKCVNDVVMGGISNSAFRIESSDHGVFSGNVSLENNGGFASVKVPHQKLLPKGYKSISLRVKGDGQHYKFRIKSNLLPNNSSYSKDFETKDREWIEVILELSDFTPTLKGNVLSGYPDLTSDRIEGIGFLISGKQEGPFRLEISEISLK
ncbi:MAG: CIA30 family protein [Bacteroidota bacterium]